MGVTGSAANVIGLSQPLSFLNLFLVSIYLIAFETTLARYFALTTGSEYGYLIISIVMTGLSLSGVILSLFENFFRKFRRGLFFITPVLMVCSTITGMYLVTQNDFNPFELQHDALWKSQLFNIASYYLELIPVFFFSGIYIGINFVVFANRISRVYAWNLLGSAVGALLVLGLMFFIHPFYLLAAILPSLFLPSFLSLGFYYRTWARSAFISVLVIMAAGFAALEVVAIHHQFGKFPYFKPVYSSLNIQGNRVVEEKLSPAGYYMVLDNLSEFDAIDLSNNYDTLGAGPAPRSYGVYKDGQRIISLIKQEPDDFSYLKGALDAFPYQVKSHPSALIVGTEGGFKILEALAHKPELLVALEPDPVIFDLVNENPASRELLKNPALSFSRQSPFSLLARGKQKFDLIDVSSDLLFQNPNGIFFFTEDALEIYLDALKDKGVISFEIPIGEFSVYALKMFQTIRAGLNKAGAAHPESQIIVYRSPWTAQLLVSRKPFDRSVIKKLEDFCRKRSFDTSYFPGINPQKLQIWNDLPSLSFDEQGVSESVEASDSLMSEMIELVRRGVAQDNFFDFSPSSIDRPNFFSVLRLKNLGKIFANLSIIPQEEIGNIINMIVLAQAAVFALLILFLPFTRIHRIPSASIFLRAAAYFGCLGLAFLFIEIALINWLSFFLNDYTSSFAMVLSVMLIFSGLGSWLSARHLQEPVRGLRVPLAAIITTLVVYILLLPQIVALAIDLPFAWKSLVIVAMVAPISLAMGFFFPLGLSALTKNAGFLIPWAWAVNGAFSIISTPLANLIALRCGYITVFIVSACLYATAFLTFPRAKLQ